MKRTWSIEEKVSILKEAKTAGVVETCRKHGLYVYFDVNKDLVKPESYGTLKAIADVLNENPDLRIKIVGYTDSDGSDVANLDLSKRRSASVKSELAKSFGIEVTRLESDGLGETKPVAPNDTPVNKALNRRVEFIKL